MLTGLGASLLRVSNRDTDLPLAQLEFTSALQISRPYRRRKGMQLAITGSSCDKQQTLRTHHRVLVSLVSLDLTIPIRHAQPKGIALSKARIRISTFGEGETP